MKPIIQNLRNLHIRQMLSVGLATMTFVVWLISAQPNTPVAIAAGGCSVPDGVCTTVTDS